MVTPRSMKNPWILVTGASGFIGGALVRRLVERGAYVRAFVRAGANLTGLGGLPTDRFEIAVGDVTVEHTVYRALVGCDQLFHVAGAFEYGPKHAKAMVKDAGVAVRAVLGAARRRGIQNIVVTSSTATLGSTEAAEPMDESHAFNLVDPEPYVAAKVEAARVVDELVDGGMPIVSVLPSAVFGPGDVKPTPNGASLVRYLSMSPSFSVPTTEGGISVVDVDDVVSGHIRAMEVGEVGTKYVLGGENVTYTQFFEMLADITGLAEPSNPWGRGATSLLATAIELGAKWSGRQPILTRRLVRDYAHRYVWVTSERAKQELDYEHRPARETLARSVRWLLENGRVPNVAAERVRLELRPV
jgi:dihydroflavonol-4-reductase